MHKNKITAVLGPTNTGKTYMAIETMLSFETGMIGFPLRLLAREVYDKIVKKISSDKVALITGEEKIIPTNAKYYLCTVESMPIEKNLEFIFEFSKKLYLSLVIVIVGFEPEIFFIKLITGSVITSAAENNA